MAIAESCGYFRLADSCKSFRPPAAGNPPPRRAPSLGLHAPPGSPGRFLQLAEPPHPRRVTPRGKQQQHRLRDDLAVRSPDSSREVLRAIGVDEHLRTSAPCRTVRPPRHVPDLPARELLLKLAPTLTVPHGLSPHPRSTRRPSSGHGVPTAAAVAFAHTRARRPASSSRRGVLAEAYRNSSGSSARRARVSDLFSGTAGSVIRDPGPVLRRRSLPRRTGRDTVSAPTSQCRGLAIHPRSCELATGESPPATSSSTSSAPSPSSSTP